MAKRVSKKRVSNKVHLNSRALRALAAKANLEYIATSTPMKPDLLDKLFDLELRDFNTGISASQPKPLLSETAKTNLAKGYLVLFAVGLITAGIMVPAIGVGLLSILPTVGALVAVLYLVDKYSV